MFVIHITYNNGGRPTITTKTNRVTYMAHAPGEVLILGTLPNITIIPMETISSYWIEHE